MVEQAVYQSAWQPTTSDDAYILMLGNIASLGNPLNEIQIVAKELQAAAPAALGEAQIVGKEVQSVVQAEKVASSLPDDALVCRGGSCLAEYFQKGGVVGPDGKLSEISVNSKGGKSLKELTSVGIPHKKVGVTTVGEVRGLGGDVKPSPSLKNPFHADLFGITADQAEELFRPTIPNPSEYLYH